MQFNLDSIVSWAKRRGFVYPGSAIYGGLANSWDLGPYGVLLRKNIADAWWKTFVQERTDIVGLDAAILMNPKTWVASGHVGGFSDPLIDCKKCKARHRADKIIEEKIFKDNIAPADLNDKLGVENIIPDSWTYEQQRKFFDEYNIKCPNCGGQDWTDIRKFNLMFKTFQGIVEDETAAVYLRPETAQGIFVNFKNVIDTMRVRVPFGIAQIGKAFRNEITPGNFLFRVREFEQMEIEYFVHPSKDEEAFEQWKKDAWNFRTETIGIKAENIRLRDHEADELSHYSKGTTDIEYKFPWSWGELCAAGARRTDFDLKQHMQHSGIDLSYIDPKTGEKYVPYVIEPSFGLTRAILTVMFDCYDEEELTTKNGEKETRVVARFHKNIAPIKFAVLPLIEKDEKMLECARGIFNELKKQYSCEFDTGGNIGKRYRRQDEIGTPYCITVDHQTLEDGTVTIRDRDTMEQTRVKIADIKL